MLMKKIFTLLAAAAVGACAYAQSVYTAVVENPNEVDYIASSVELTDNGNGTYDLVGIITGASYNPNITITVDAEDKITAVDYTDGYMKGYNNYIVYDYGTGVWTYLYWLEGDDYTNALVDLDEEEYDRALVFGMSTICGEDYASYGTITVKWNTADIRDITTLNTQAILPDDNTELMNENPVVTQEGGTFIVKDLFEGSKVLYSYYAQVIVEVKDNEVASVTATQNYIGYYNNEYIALAVDGTNAEYIEGYDNGAYDGALKFDVTLTGHSTYTVYATGTVTIMWPAETDAITSVAADAQAEAVYYNLSGVRVANPTPGIYVVKQGNKVTKQVIR